MERGIKEGFVRRDCVYAEPFGWLIKSETIRPLICFAFGPVDLKNGIKDLFNI